MNAGTLHDYALSVGLPISWCDSTGMLYFTDGSKREATPAEIAGALQAEQDKATRRDESTTARDGAKRALTALDTIITGIDGATLTQAKTAIKQLAQIQRHIILATLGR